MSPDAQPAPDGLAPEAAPAAAAAAAAERAARQSYGRLVALLAWQWRDVAAAEDALSQAFAAALTHWPHSGVPTAPEAWLMRCAQRELLQAARHRRVELDPRVTALFEEEPSTPGPEAGAPLPDRRLALLFVCAHPALDETLHAPLMLQAVLGLDAARIAEAWLVSPTAMAQRLVRAKSKIRLAGLRFEEPEARERPARLGAVLQALYGAYTLATHTARIAQPTTPGAAAGPSGASDEGSAPPSLPALAEEAIDLASIAAAPGNDAEALGLLALMLYAQARRPAQFSAAGAFVPLAQQDPAHWDAARIRQAEHCLAAAGRLRAPGPFQIEAAIQSAHCERLRGQPTPWPAVAALYGHLQTMAPSIGAAIGQAVAQAEAGHLASGLAQLQALQQQHAAALARHQPYWVALAHLQGLAGQPAAAAWQQAIGLTEDPRVRAYLLGRAASASAATKQATATAGRISTPPGR